MYFKRSTVQMGASLMWEISRVGNTLFRVIQFVVSECYTDSISNSLCIAFLFRLVLDGRVHILDETVYVHKKYTSTKIELIKDESDAHQLLLNPYFVWKRSSLGLKTCPRVQNNFWPHPPRILSRSTIGRGMHTGTCDWIAPITESAHGELCTWRMVEFDLCGCGQLEEICGIEFDICQ